MKFVESGPVKTTPTNKSMFFSEEKRDENPLEVFESEDGGDPNRVRPRCLAMADERSAGDAMRATEPETPEANEARLSEIMARSSRVSNGRNSLRRREFEVGPNWRRIQGVMDKLVLVWPERRSNR